MPIFCGHLKRMSEQSSFISDMAFVRHQKRNLKKIPPNILYEDEQAQLKVEIVNLQKEVEVQERQIENLEQFIQRVRRYTTLTELTPYALRELVKAVYVEASDKSSGKRKQKIHISYDLIGFIPVDVLTKAEQA